MNIRIGKEARDRGKQSFSYALVMDQNDEEV